MGNEKQGRVKMQNTSKIQRSLVLNRVTKCLLDGFCVKQGQGLKALATHPHPNFP